jgi:hypothetical protein
MANRRIQDLPALTPATTLILPVTNGATTGRITVSEVCGVITSGQISSALGYTPVNSTGPAIAKAWVNFNGTAGSTVGTEFRCTVRSSYNIDRVVRNANGDYSVYFTTAFANVNYCAQVTSGTNSVLGSNAPTAPAHCIGTQAVGNIRVFTYNPNTGAAAAGLLNRAIVNVAIWS